MVRRRVLIVDDERLLAEVLGEILGDHHDVEVATTAGAAIRRLRDDGAIEVVLCDIQLPDGTAFDVLAAYAAAWPGRQQRLVFVTGGADGAELRAAQAAGHRLLRKPFDVDAVPALIDEIATAWAARSS